MKNRLRSIVDTTHAGTHFPPPTRFSLRRRLPIEKSFSAVYLVLTENILKLESLFCMELEWRMWNEVQTLFYVETVT